MAARRLQLVPVRYSQASNVRSSCVDGESIHQPYIHSPCGTTPPAHASVCPPVLQRAPRPVASVRHPLASSVSSPSLWWKSCFLRQDRIRSPQGKQREPELPSASQHGQPVSAMHRTRVDMCRTSVLVLPSTCSPRCCRFEVSCLRRF